MATKRTKKMGSGEREALLETLQARFEKHTERHQGITWESVRKRLDADDDKLWSLGEMERSGGEPDVIGREGKSGPFLFFDCAAESPKDRRSVCYDRAALDARKEHKPKASAVELAEAMGAFLLNEEEYRRLQGLGEFDSKTSSWLLTPPAIRKLGGAVFGDYRFGTVWVYHNGAESYYAARGFRCKLRV